MTNQVKANSCRISLSRPLVVWFVTTVIVTAAEVAPGLAQDPPRKTARLPVPDAAAIRKLADTTRPLHAKLGEPKPGEWLDIHHEKGQSFDEYLRAHRQPIRERYQTM